MKAQRDEFIEYLFAQAKSDKDIIFISVDMGAPALDKWRAELPEQFVAAGISEQNAINFAAGLAAAGKKPFVYMMACWVARCFEQIRYSCAMPGNPVTIIGNGVGLGYAPAGPAHEPTEDLCYMRGIDGLEIYSPSSSAQVKQIAKECVDIPALRYIRLERSVSSRLAEISNSPTNLGIDVCKSYVGSVQRAITIISSGYMLDRCLDIAHELNLEHGLSIQVIDLWRIKPLDTGSLKVFISNSEFIVTVEEQMRDGAFGSAILEALSDESLLIPTLRLSLTTAFPFENGTREELLNMYGLEKDSMKKRIIDSISEMGFLND
jgi:transketolase